MKKIIATFLVIFASAAVLIFFHYRAAPAFEIKRASPNAVMLSGMHRDQGEAVALQHGFFCSASKQRQIGPTIRCLSFPQLEEIWSNRAHVEFLRNILPFHTQGFPRDLHISEDSLLTVGTDHFVRRWELATGQLIWEHQHHQDAVWKVGEADGIVVTAGRDGTVIAASLSNGEYLWSHTFHRDGVANSNMVRSVRIVADLVISTGFDGQIIIVKLENGSIYRRLSFGHRIKTATLHNDKILYAPWTSDRSADIIALDLETGNILWSFDKVRQENAQGFRGENAGVEEMIVHEGLVIAAWDDGSIGGINLKSGELVFSHKIHQVSARSVSASETIVASIDRNGDVVFFDYKVSVDLSVD